MGHPCTTLRVICPSAPPSHPHLCLENPNRVMNTSDKIALESFIRKDIQEVGLTLKKGVGVLVWVLLLLVSSMRAMSAVAGG